MDPRELAQERAKAEHYARLEAQALAAYHRRSHDALFEDVDGSPRSVAGCDDRAERVPADEFDSLSPREETALVAGRPWEVGRL